MPKPMNHQNYPTIFSSIDQIQQKPGSNKKMDISLKPISLLSLSLTFFICFVLFSPSSVKSIPEDFNSLVYKECSNETYTKNPTDSNSYSQTLSSLFQDLISQSSHSMFFKTTVGDEETAISGLFQCRGDLNNEDCYNCVNSLSELANTLCGETVSARIQLFGCYVDYETDGISPENSGSGPRLLYKSCEESVAVPSGFRERIDAAFVVVESGVGSDNGFYETNYESVHVLVQCEGDLGDCDCGECVSSAVVVAQDECENSVTGEIYMDNCFLSYTYSPNGEIPSDSHSENGGGNNTGKSVAIVVGGLAALGFGFMLWLLIKSKGKKDEDF